MSLRIAIVVPVAAAPDEAGRYHALAHRYVPLGHAEALARRGHEVHVFFDGPPRTFEPAPRVTVHVRSGRLPTVRGRVVGPHLVQAALRTSPDVLHLHHLLAVENLWAATSGPAPVFAEYHGGAAPRLWPKRRVLRRLSRRLAGAFFCSPAHREALVRAGSWDPRAPFTVSPEITARFEGVAERPPPGPGPRVLVVGRCEAPKAPLDTVATLEALVAAAPQARVRWASPGGADAARVRRALAASPRLGARVELGPAPFDEMAAHYAAAEVVISTSTREIGGTVLSEALSQGAPFAAFHLPTFEALAAGCPAVRLVAPRDPSALARAALELAARPELRAAARARFEAALSYDAIAAGRSELYRRALSGPRGASWPTAPGAGA